jgi:dTDP-4-dehydrorhamnose 3,5-epimerase-like enzyme
MFPEHGDERGHLVVVEGNKDVPFEIKRVFYIYGSERDVVRGRHANRRSEFVLVNIAGGCKVKVSNGKGGKAVFVLNKPYEGLYLPPMYWKEMYGLSEDSLLLIFSSEYYDPEEYIHDYGEYIKEIMV